MEAVAVREFQAGDAEAFRRMNEEWIVKYFELEPKDEYVFANPEGTILKQGGRIFFVVEGDVALGCCALLRMGEGEFEVGKMSRAGAYGAVGGDGGGAEEWSDEAVSGDELCADAGAWAV